MVLPGFILQEGIVSHIEIPGKDILHVMQGRIIGVIFVDAGYGDGYLMVGVPLVVEDDGLADCICSLTLVILCV